MKVGRPMLAEYLLPVRLKQTVSLSKPAKLRLKWLDYYTKTGNKSLTCRHFGITRTTLDKWLKRFNKYDLTSLEERSKRPHKIREMTTPLEVVSLVKKLRIENMEYSKYKLSRILKRDYGYSVSPSTIGRIISKAQLFRPKLKKRRKPHVAPGIPKLAKPQNLVAKTINEVFEFDVKHMPHLGTKRYGFVCIDTFSRKSYVHVSSSITSQQAKLAWRQATKRLGIPKIVVTDHGSENHGHFQTHLANSPTTHYFARVSRPTDKAFVESFIGTLETECLSFGGLGTTVKEQQQLINTWLTKYHYFRPHAALNYLTPYEFESKMKGTKVYTML